MATDDTNPHAPASTPAPDDSAPDTSASGATPPPPRYDAEGRSIPSSPAGEAPASSAAGSPPLPPSAFPGAPSQPVAPSAHDPFAAPGAGQRPASTPYGAPQAPASAPYGAPSSGGAPQQPYGSAPQQPYGQQPSGSAYPSYASAGATKPSAVLSILSLVASIVGALVVVPTFGAGVVFSVAGVVLGHIAARREPTSRRLWISGLIVGYVGIALAVLVWVALIAFFLALPGASSGTFDGGYGPS